MMELNYTKNGDYLIPDIQLSVQEQKPLGRSRDWAEHE